MSDQTPDETGSAGTATATAAPPARPPAPPTTGTAAPGPRDGKGRRGAVIAAIVMSVLAVVLIGVGIWLVISVAHGSRGGSAASSAAVQTAFESAMKKAGVSAAYPSSPPVLLTAVQPTGSHHFSATFTPDELAALIDTFSYTADVAGMQIAIPNATVTFPSPGVAAMQAQVTANGGTYNGTVTIPLTYANGSVTSAGATDLSVEGLPASSAQKAQVSDALVLYANSIIAAAPGLTVDTAAITSAGLQVTGTAPDSLAYP